MLTQFIGLKQFRENIATYTTQAQKKKTRLIVLKRNVPMFEVRPVDKKEFVKQKLVEELKEARQQVKEGKVYTEAQIMKRYGLL